MITNYIPFCLTMDDHYSLIKCLNLKNIAVKEYLQISTCRDSDI